MTYKAHIFIGHKSKKYFPRYLDYLPCVGDELRITRTLFLKVVRIIHCLDEPSGRVNIETTKIKLLRVKGRWKE